MDADPIAMGQGGQLRYATQLRRRRRPRPESDCSVKGLDSPLKRCLVLSEGFRNRMRWQCNSSANGYLIAIQLWESRVAVPDFPGIVGNWQRHAGMDVAVPLLGHRDRRF